MLVYKLPIIRLSTMPIPSDPTFTCDGEWSSLFLDSSSAAVSTQSAVTSLKTNVNNYIFITFSTHYRILIVLDIVEKMLKC